MTDIQTLLDDLEASQVAHKQQVKERRAEIGARLKAAREARGLSSRRVALAIGRDSSNINKIEHGRGSWSTVAARLYLRVLEKAEVCR